MKSAYSARVLCILGATLVATSLSQIALAETTESAAQGLHTGGVNGIHSGGVLGIHSGGVLGIHSGGVNGIHTGGVNGIHTGGVNGIHSGGVTGIHTGGVNGIHTGGVLGIHSGGVTGIHTGGVNGIHTGGVNGIHTGGVNGIWTGEAYLVLSAPVASVDLNGGTFVSMGQTVSASREMLGGLAPGDFVSVYGSVSGPGYLYADAVFLNADRYIPGSSEVLVSGIATDIDRSMGLATLGSLKVDYTSTLSSGLHPESGYITFFGTQPQLGTETLTGRAFERGLIN